MIQITGICLLTSLNLVYDEINSSAFSNYFQIFAAIFGVFRILFKLVTVKYQSGKKLQKLREIWKFYANKEMPLDIFSSLVILITCIDSSNVFVFLQLVTLLKIPECLDEIETLEIYFIKSLYNEQYWSLAKILLFNFSFAHIISIGLTAMAGLNPSNSWIVKKGLIDSPWYEQYIWSYYWANTIMLTIGFGDFVASNYQ